MASRMRLVTAASPDKTVQPSMNGSSGAPTPSIWIRWSITENQTKPWFSAHCALALTISKASVGSGLNTHDGLWIPNFIEIAPVLICASHKRGELIRRGHASPSTPSNSTSSRCFASLAPSAAPTPCARDCGNDCLKSEPQTQ